MRHRVMATLACFIMATTSQALAQDDTTPLASDGNWIAAEHTDSQIGAADMCMALSSEGLAFRTDENDNEVRYFDNSWSLPADISGTLTVKVNGHTYPLDITSNSNKMVAAEVTTDQLQAIVSDMNKSASLVLIAGAAPPVTISLSGSNSVVAAYLTCADIPEPTGAATGGANPFASSTN